MFEASLKEAEVLLRNTTVFLTCVQGQIIGEPTTQEVRLWHFCFNAISCGLHSWVIYCPVAAWLKQSLYRKESGARKRSKDVYFVDSGCGGCPNQIFVSLQRSQQRRVRAHASVSLSSTVYLAFLLWFTYLFI